LPGGRDYLSRTLRQLRQDIGIPGTRAARDIGISQSRISRIESGVLMPTSEEITTLCRLYHAPARTRRALLAALDDLKAEPPSARVVIARGNAYRLQQRFGRIEANATEIREFQPGIVPGLLQTQEYMAAVFADGNDLTPEDQAASVDARKARTEILANPSKEFTLIMAEGALRWQVVSPQVMTAQLDYLASMTGAVRLGVIPMTRSVRLFPMHGFYVYDAHTVIVGIRTGTSFLTDPRDVAEYLKLFADLERLAVYGDDARQVIEQTAAAYRAI
jgi:transcriptional regulator with XRE-family HTH domain